MVSHRCKSCKWFDSQHVSLKSIEHSDQADVLDASRLGYCRKHRPQPIHFEGYFYGRWPLVDTNDLCGEFRLDEVQ